MSRIGSFGASQMYMSRLSVIQQRMYQEQLQVSTEKKSVNYTGIAADTDRLINLENEKKRADKFVMANNLADTRLNAAEVSMKAIEKDLKDFQDRLVNYAQFSSKEQSDVKQLQEFAFQAMLDIKAYLSSNINGQYIFSGGRTAEDPVVLPASTLNDFQQIYDGNGRTYPTTRDASLQDVHTATVDTGNLTVSVPNGTISAATAGSLGDIAPGSLIAVGGAGNNVGQSFTVQAVDPTNTTIRVSKLLTSAGETGVSIKVNGDKPGVAPTDYASMSFSGNGDTITFAAPTTFDQAQFAVGTVFNVSGSASVTDIDLVNKNNDGPYEVASVSVGPPFQITVKSPKLAVEGGPVAATLSTDSWYRGDTIELQQQVDDNRTIELGVYASDPAFDKAFRALALIAQGTYGTAGSLENNMERVEQARDLIQDALSRNTTGPGPFGVEEAGDLDQLRAKVGVGMNMIATTNEKHTAFSGFLEMRIIGLENVDKTEAITRLLDDQTALEASYKALTTVRGLSLLNYMN